MSLRLVEWFVKRGPIKLTSESYTHHLITTRGNPEKLAWLGLCVQS